MHECTTNMEVIGLENNAKWNEIVCDTGNYDFYHLPAYHALDNSGKPVLLYYSKNGRSCAFPIIVRDIDNTGYKDVTSVYGYAGAVAKSVDLDSAFLAGFRKELKLFFSSENIVSAFSRLHPLLAINDCILDGLGIIKKENLTVGIDLKTSEEEQLSQYTHSVKQALVLLKKENVSVKIAENIEEIKEFAKIYTQNMLRVSASQNYFFPESYFIRFLATIPSFLLLAIKDGEIIAGSLNSQCNGIIQTHLAATKTGFLDISPLKLIWHKVREYGMVRDMHYVHYGGGLSGKNDTLFQFKAHFSDLRFRFKTWRYVHNKKAYKELNFTKFGNNIPKNSFFPIYRI